MGLKKIGGDGGVVEEKGGEEEERGFGRGGQRGGIDDGAGGDRQWSQGERGDEIVREGEKKEIWRERKKDCSFKRKGEKNDGMGKGIGR